MNTQLALDRYRLLGRSGLRVSPLALGTMTFGSEWGWGAEADEARRLFDTYVDRGGNFVDSANFYTNGRSEEFLGEFAKGKREELVIATKYSLTMRSRDPNSGGNHRKSMLRSVEASLKRLQTDYIDLLYLHAWDNRTPPDEIMRAFDDLVRAGKVLYVGISDAPAWQISRMQAIAELRGWSPLIALQIEYNLAERTVERDLLPMAKELGLGVLAWSPLAGGILSGKYSSSDLQAQQAKPSPSGSRKDINLAHGLLSERSLRIANVVKRIASHIGKTPAQVALAWLLEQPGVTAPIIGARTVKQLEENLGMLEVTLSEDQKAELDGESCIDLGFPHEFLQQPMTKKVLFGDNVIAERV